MSNTFDPWKTFDVSPEEHKAILERQKIRDAVKAEFRKKYTDPFRPTTGYIFDPQIQRNYSAKFTFSEYFRASKYVILSIAGLIVPFGICCYIVNRSMKRSWHEKDSGNLTVKDRLNEMPANP